MWIILVWIISGLCYMPLYFQKIGYQVPGILIQTRYIFVFVPLIISLVYLGKASIKKWIYSLITHKARFGIIGIIIVVACTGIIGTYIFDKVALNGIINPFSMGYLFIMALIEECAWRGFRLEQLQTKRCAILIVSLEWALWHIPMWVIRNSQGLIDVCVWIVYTVLVGIILGKCMTRYKNILAIAVLHTTFNVSFLMPVKGNVVAVLCLVIVLVVFEKIRGMNGVR